jgi:hypothetical protein
MCRRVCRRTAVDPSRAALTVVDPPRDLLDGGRSAPGSARRWSICPRTCLTVVDLPTFRRRVGSADRPPSGHSRGRWSIRSASSAPRQGRSGHRRHDQPDGGRSAPTTRRGNVGRSTTVRQARRRIDHRQAGSEANRPPSGRLGGESTTVEQIPGRIDHRRADPGADRPPSDRFGGRSTTVSGRPDGYRPADPGIRRGRSPQPTRTTGSASSTKYWQTCPETTTSEQ